MTKLGLIVPAKNNSSTIPVTLGSGSNSEQLFAAGWSASFLSSMANVARRMRIAFPEDATVNAEIDPYSAGCEYSLEARLNIFLPGINRNAALALAEAADWICPYSRAIRDSVVVTISLI